MKILSLDPGSANMGWAILEKKKTRTNYLASGSFKTVKKGKFDLKAGEYLFSIRKNILTLLRNHEGIDLIVSERFGSSRRLKGAVVIPRIIAIVQEVCYSKFKKEAPLMSPRQWKPAIVKKSSAEKEESIKWAKRKGFIQKNAEIKHDESDAIAIGYYYLEYHS